jgi:hypothetical protein
MLKDLAVACGIAAPRVGTDSLMMGAMGTGMTPPLAGLTT